VAEKVDPEIVSSADQDQNIPAVESDTSEDQMPVGDTAQESPVTPEERSILQGTAKKRALEVKDYLVERGVDPARLLICFSEFEDKEDAFPRVEIAL
jgi:hypothetical protein